MKKLQYKRLLYRLVIVLLAINALNAPISQRNVGIDVGQWASYHRDLSVNKIESIGELILEECLGMMNAVPEHDDPEDESELIEQGLEYDFLGLFSFAALLPLVHNLITGILPFQVYSLPVPVQEIIAPPPQA